MGDKDLTKKILKDSRFYYCLFVLVFVFCVLFVSFIHPANSRINSEWSDYSDGWTYADGERVDFDDLMRNGEEVIQKEVSGSLLRNRVLCFYSKNIYFTVLLDDEVIYDFHPKSLKLLGKAYGIFPNSVTIPLKNAKGVVTIRLENIYDGTDGLLSEVSLGDGGRFLIGEIQKDLAEVVFCLMMFALGIVMFSLGLLGKYLGERRYEIVSMGSFAVVLSIWIAMETEIPSILTGLPVATHFVDYMMLDLLPFAFVLFLSYLTGHRDSKVPLVIGLLSSVNILFSMISTLLGFRDYHELLFLSHMIFGLTILLVIAQIVDGFIKKRLKRGFLVILIVSVSLPLIIGSAEMIRYRLDPASFRGLSLYKYVLFLFVFLCGAYEIRNVTEMARNGQHAQIMEKLAFNDSLTGLLNREAYNRELEELKTKNEPLTFVMLDMNHLKKVNDRLGHLTGDEYIKKIGQFIRESFPAKDKCFRIGGDEFFVISACRISDKVFQDGLAGLNIRIENYNREKNAEIPMSIAIGYAEYHPGVETAENVIKETDEKMYRQKKTMRMEVGGL